MIDNNNNLFINIYEHDNEKDKSKITEYVKREKQKRITKLPDPTVQKPLTRSTRTRPVLKLSDRKRGCCLTGISSFTSSTVGD